MVKSKFKLWFLLCQTIMTPLWVLSFIFYIFFICIATYGLCTEGFSGEMAVPSVVMIILMSFLFGALGYEMCMWSQKLQVSSDTVTIYYWMLPFSKREYNICDFDGYYLTKEFLITRGGREGFDVAWLCKDDILKLKIFDRRYTNFYELIGALNLEYKGKLDAGKKYKKYETVKAVRIQNEEYEKLLSSVKKEPSSSQKNLNKLEIHIDTKEVSENDSKTYKIN